MRSIYDGVLRSPGADFQAVYDGRRTPLRYVDVDLSTARSIAAGTPLILDVASDFFLADVDPVNQGEAVVHFQEMQLDKVSAPVYVTRGFTARMPFTRLLIENVAQAGKRLRFFFGVGIDMDPGGNNVTVSGTVSVSDVGKALAKAGLTYAGYGGVGGIAGQIAGVQLWNPAGSGVNFIVEAVGYYASGGALQAGIRGSNATIAAVIGAAPSTLVSTGGAGPTVGEIRGGTAAAFTSNAIYYPATTSGANAFGEWRPTKPLILPPGTGVHVQGQVAMDCGASFQFYTEAV